VEKFVRRHKKRQARSREKIARSSNSGQRHVEETMVICEERVNKERMLLLELEERHQAIMTRARDYMVEQEKDVVHCREIFPNWLL